MIQFYSTLFLNWFNLILFNSIEFDLLYCSVLYLISMNDLCLSVRPSVRLSFCLSVCVCVYLYEQVYVFSSLLFLYSFISFLFFIFISLSLLFSYERLPHTHTHTDTDTHKTYIWIYVPSYDSYILLQKRVSEESYSSDSIISYLI